MSDINNYCTKIEGTFLSPENVNFIPEENCPDRLLTFSNNGNTITINCDNTCIHHIDYKSIGPNNTEHTI